jgi:hypothetical protein
MELSVEDFSVDTQEPQKTKPAGYIILAVVIILAWLPWLKIVPKLDYLTF